MQRKSGQTVTERICCPQCMWKVSLKAKFQPYFRSLTFVKAPLLCENHVYTAHGDHYKLQKIRHSATLSWLQDNQHYNIFSKHLWRT